jgi:hypothetical protein
MCLTPARVLARLIAILALAAATISVPPPARAQDPVVRDTATVETARTYVLRTRDGSLFIGLLTRATVDSVYFVSAGGPIVVPRSAVLELRELGRGAMRQGVYWAPNPGATRLFFAPTARMLEKGEGYFSDTYLFFLNFVGGVTSRVTMGGGFSVFPTEDFTNNIVYLTPKVGLVQGPNFNLAAGALIGYAGFNLFDEGNLGSFGVVYGVGTLGSPDASVTGGVGTCYTGSDVGNRPMFMIGGEARIGRRASLVSENYVNGLCRSGELVSYGVRFFGDRLSVDLAFWNLPGEQVYFPGIPYVGFAVRF